MKRAPENLNTTQINTKLSQESIGAPWNVWKWSLRCPNRDRSAAWPVETPCLNWSSGRAKELTKGCQINEMTLFHKLKKKVLTSKYAWKDSLGAFLVILSLKKCHLINLTPFTRARSRDFSPRSMAALQRFFARRWFVLLSGRFGMPRAQFSPLRCK